MWTRPLLLSGIDGVLVLGTHHVGFCDQVKLVPDCDAGYVSRPNLLQHLTGFLTLRQANKVLVDMP
jgi:hypothetical protein